MQIAPTTTITYDLPKGCHINYFEDRPTQAYTLWVPTFKDRYGVEGRLRVWHFCDTEAEARTLAEKAAEQAAPRQAKPRRRTAAVA